MLSPPGGTVVNDAQRERRAEEQKQTVAACREAMPSQLGALWETIVHAPSVAYEPVVEALEAALSDESARSTAVLSWLGHGGGACPVCRMLVGRLLFAFAEPIQGLRAVLTGQPSDAVLDGAGLYLSSQLRPLHARAAGISDARLAELQRQAANLPSDVKVRLLARWQAAGGAPGGLELLA